MEFFIAFFGGLFLLIQFAVRKTREDGIKKADNSWEARRKPVAERLKVNEEDEKAVAEMETWPSDDLYAYLEEDLAYIFGQNYKSVIPFDDKSYRNFHGRLISPCVHRKKGTTYTKEAYMNYWITQILYSKRGKFEPLLDVFGLNVGVGNPETNLRMCRRIEKNMRACGANVHLEVELERYVTEPSKKHLSNKVKVKETQHRYWEGRELESIMELHPARPDLP